MDVSTLTVTVDPLLLVKSKTGSWMACFIVVESMVGGIASFFKSTKWPFASCCKNYWFIPRAVVGLASLHQWTRSSRVQFDFGLELVKTYKLIALLSVYSLFQLVKWFVSMFNSFFADFFSDPFFRWDTHFLSLKELRYLSSIIIQKAAKKWCLGMRRDTS